MKLLSDRQITKLRKALEGLADLKRIQVTVKEMPMTHCAKSIKEIKFQGIDEWNRPVFKAVNSNERFGSIFQLFDRTATEQEVLAEVAEKDLVYFGNSFGCEPMGTNALDLKIIRSRDELGITD